MDAEHPTPPPPSPATQARRRPNRIFTYAILTGAGLTLLGVLGMQRQGRGAGRRHAGRSGRRRAAAARARATGTAPGDAARAGRPPARRAGLRARHDQLDVGADRRRQGEDLEHRQLRRAGTADARSAGRPDRLPRRRRRLRHQGLRPGSGSGSRLPAAARLPRRRRRRHARTRRARAGRIGAQDVVEPGPRRW